MTPFTVLEAIAAPLIRPNIDTDAIIPSREMRSVSKSGLADGLFAGWRYMSLNDRTPNPAFVLNDPAFATARFLLAGDNFGCGSSREHAAWALAEYGFRSVIAPSFNPIFEGNCIRNGIVPVKLALEQVHAIATAAADPNHVQPITVDLTNQVVLTPDGATYAFSIASEAREMLLFGLDQIELTKTFATEIDEFITRDRQARPWVYLPPPEA